MTKSFLFLAKSSFFKITPALINLGLSADLKIRIKEIICNNSKQNMHKKIKSLDKYNKKEFNELIKFIF